MGIFSGKYLPKPYKKITVICKNGKIIEFTTDIYNENKTIERIKKLYKVKEIKKQDMGLSRD